MADVEIDDDIYQRAYGPPETLGSVVPRNALKVKGALPAWFTHRLKWRNYWTNLNWSRDSGGGETAFAQPMVPDETPIGPSSSFVEMVPDPNRTVDDRKPTKSLFGAEAFSSGSKRGSHLVMMDIDHEAVLLPSSRPGHYHLIVDVECSEEKLMNLLDAAAETGIVERGYAGVSRSRGEAFLRLPWIRKGFEKRDAEAALEAWVDDVPPVQPDEVPF